MIILPVQTALNLHDNWCCAVGVGNVVRRCAAFVHGMVGGGKSLSCLHVADPPACPRPNDRPMARNVGG